MYGSTAVLQDPEDFTQWKSRESYSYVAKVMKDLETPTAIKDNTNYRDRSSSGSLPHDIPFETTIQKCAELFFSEQIRNLRQSMFLEQVYRLADSSETRKGALSIFSRLDALLNVGAYSECDSVLSDLDLGRLKNPDMMLAFLTITFAAKDHLQNRGALYSAVRKEFEQIRGSEYTAKLLDNLQ